MTDKYIHMIIYIHKCIHALISFLHICKVYAQHIYQCADTQTSVHTYIPIHICMHAFIHTHIHAYTYTHINAHIHTYAHRQTYAYDYFLLFQTYTCEQIYHSTSMIEIT